MNVRGLVGLGQRGWHPLTFLYQMIYHGSSYSVSQSRVSSVPQLILRTAPLHNVRQKFQYISPSPDKTSEATCCCCTGRATFPGLACFAFGCWFGARSSCVCVLCCQTRLFGASFDAESAEVDVTTTAPPGALLPCI